MKWKAHLLIELYASNVTNGFDLGCDSLDLWFSSLALWHLRVIKSFLVTHWFWIYWQVIWVKINRVLMGPDCILEKINPVLKRIPCTKLQILCQATQRCFHSSHCQVYHPRAARGWWRCCPLSGQSAAAHQLAHQTAHRGEQHVKLDQEFTENHSPDCSYKLVCHVRACSPNTQCKKSGQFAKL